MKKTYRLQNLGCANCAFKMENAISKIKGVKNVKISFITQRLVIEGNDENFSDIEECASKICKKIEPDCIMKAE